jgi:sulfite exporter TauE/SafE
MLPVDRQNSTRQFFQTMSYHFGRLFTYAIIGLLFGSLGKTFNLLGFQQYISIFSGLLMITLVLFPRIAANSRLSKNMYSFVGKIKSKLGKELKKKDANTLFTIGFLNGFLPCGLVYMAVLGALASSNLWGGSLYMLAFGLGTIPLMTLVSYAPNMNLLGKSGNFKKIIPVLVIAVGVLFVFRGLGLGIPFLSPIPTLEMVGNVSACH